MSSLPPSKVTASFSEDPEFYRRIGGRIASARAVLRLTQAQLAERIGITRNSVARIEAGKQRYLAHALSHIAAALNITHAGLVADDSNSPPTQINSSDIAVLRDLLANKAQG